MVHSRFRPLLLCDHCRFRLVPSHPLPSRRLIDGSGNMGPVSCLPGHTDGITHADSRGDGRYILTNGKDQAARLWDLRTALSASDTFRRVPAPLPPRTPAGESLRPAYPAASPMFSCDKPSLPPPLRHRRGFTWRYRPFEWDYRWESYPEEGRDTSHPNDRSVIAYRGHHVLTTLIRAYFSPEVSARTRRVGAAATRLQTYEFHGSYCQRAGVDGRAVRVHGERMRGRLRL